jgi:hypothetical protein
LAGLESYFIVRRNPVFLCHRDVINSERSDAPLRGERFLSEERRQEYLSRARDKLRNSMVMSKGAQDQKRPADVIGAGVSGILIRVPYG